MTPHSLPEIPPCFEQIRPPPNAQFLWPRVPTPTNGTPIGSRLCPYIHRQTEKDEQTHTVTQTDHATSVATDHISYALDNNVA